MTENKRLRRYKKGIKAERKAAWILRLKGFSVLVTRYKTPAGEVDLIVKRGKTIAFVEIKARDSVTLGKEAVTYTQRRRIEKAAEIYLSTMPRQPNAIRFDLVVVSGMWARHYPALWRVGD